MKSYAGEYSIALTDDMLGKFSAFEEFMLDYNNKVNLTAITAHEDIIQKHFLDSLLVLNAIDIAQQSKIIDVGTGAGFPGIPLKIARPDLNITLLDSLNKRVTYLQQLSQLINQDNLCLHARAEEAAHLPEYRERYDVAVSRAVASLPALCEYTLGFVKPGGYFLAMKSLEIEEELKLAENAIKQMGAVIQAVKEFSLPDNSGRTIIVIKKISHTMNKYPRKQVKITKNPL